MKIQALTWIFSQSLRFFYQLKAQRSGFQLERRSRFAREHFAFRRNAEFAKRTSTSWWAKMDSLSCGKATPVETVHWTVSKCRLSSPSQTLQSSLVGQNGLEPSTSRLSVVCSSQLSYWPIFAHFFLVEISGIEPLTSCLQGRRSPS